MKFSTWSGSPSALAQRCKATTLQQAKSVANQMIAEQMKFCRTFDKAAIDGLRSMTAQIDRANPDQLSGWETSVAGITFRVEIRKDADNG